MQDFSDRSYSTGAYETRPKVFTDMFDGIYTQRVDSICLYQIVYPSIECIDDMGVFGVQIR